MDVIHVIFDLDNTLYSSTAAMDRGITFRMLTCVADFFHINYDEAVALRAEKLPEFSTTLEWLRSEGLTDTERYFSEVHPVYEADELPFDAGLRPLLISIKQPKYILTNAPREHADRVLEKLNVADLFSGICDIRDCNLQGKPYPYAYRHALEMSGSTIDKTLFLDDQYKYTDGWEALGGTAALVGKQNGVHLCRPAVAVAFEEPPHPGRTLCIDSVYSLPSLLKQLERL
jgi:putative hydrolase of the HAD superfamily